MATPFSPSTSADSGLPVTSGTEGDSQCLPFHCIFSAAAEGGHENEVDPILEEATTLSLAVEGNTVPPYADISVAPLPTLTQSVTTIGHGLGHAPPITDMVAAEQERDYTGAARMVGHEQGRSRLDIETELAEKKSAMDILEKQLQSCNLKKDVQEQHSLMASEEHETTLAKKNDIIKELEGRVECFKVCVSKLEKKTHEERVKCESHTRHLEKKTQEERVKCELRTRHLEKKTHEERVKCESRTRHLEEELRTERKEIVQMKEENIRMKAHSRKKDEETLWSLELSKVKIDALLLECELAKARKTEVECEIAKMKEESEKKEVTSSSERIDSMCY